LFNEYGAWSDRRIVDDFFDYATFIIQRYDHLVDEWFVSYLFPLHEDVSRRRTPLKIVRSLPLMVRLLTIVRRSTNLSIATGSTRTIPSELTYRSTTMSRRD
jgi:hypothetical protein